MLASALAERPVDVTAGAGVPAAVLLAPCAVVASGFDFAFVSGGGVELAAVALGRGVSGGFSADAAEDDWLVDLDCAAAGRAATASKTNPKYTACQNRIIDPLVLARRLDRKTVDRASRNSTRANSNHREIARTFAAARGLLTSEKPGP